MSKKSRRRNRRILGALAALGTGLALANRNKGTAAADVDSGRGSGLRPTINDIPKTVTTPKTIQDNKSKVNPIPKLKVDLNLMTLDGKLKKIKI